MAYDSPAKLKAANARGYARTVARREAARAKLAASVAAWLAINHGPLARRVHDIAHGDGLAPMTLGELLRPSPIVPEELVRLALIEAGYPPARAARRAVDAVLTTIIARPPPKTNRKHNRRAKYAEASHWAKRNRIEPPTPYAVRCRLPAAPIGLGER